MQVADKEQTIEEQVEAALPDGRLYQMPEEWRLNLNVKRKESPSSITAFLLCPLKWYLDRYAGIPGETVVGFSMTLGTFVHRVLEVFYSEPKHKRSEAVLEEVFNHAWEQLKDHNEDDGIIDKSLMEEFKTLESQANNPTGFRNKFRQSAYDSAMSIIDFDGDVSGVDILGNETWIRRSVRGVNVNGKIDRRVRGKGGAEIIDDYKTGRPPEGKVDVLNPTFVSVGLYAWMRAAETAGGLPVEVQSVRLLYLGAMKRYSITITPEVLAKTDLLVNRVMELMEDAAQTGKIMITPAEISSKPPCNWCVAKNICPAFQEDGSFEPMREELGI